MNDKQANSEPLRSSPWYWRKHGQSKMQNGGIGRVQFLSWALSLPIDERHVGERALLCKILTPIFGVIACRTCPVPFLIASAIFHHSKKFVKFSGGPMVRTWDQEICSFYGFRFEPCGCSYDSHWRLIWSLTSTPIGLVEMRASWPGHPR